ncbi:MAG: hypothetical protein WBK20_09890 [Spirochaetota bacterium]
MQGEKIKHKTYKEKQKRRFFAEHRRREREDGEDCLSTDEIGESFAALVSLCLNILIDAR